MSTAVIDALRARGWTVTCAESCTGGMVAAAITDVAGSSDVFERGFVTYSNEAKREMLGVSAQCLEMHGAVSEEVACEMALGARNSARADVAVAISGIAGPGGSDHKPEGRVCFAVAVADHMARKTVEFGALGRANVRSKATEYALKLILDAAQS